jgi:cell division protein ZapB
MPRVCSYNKKSGLSRPNTHKHMMISDFELLAEKVAKLAELTHALRVENAALRNEVTALTTQNQDVRERMQQAHERITALLAQLPAEVLKDEEVSA